MDGDDYEEALLLWLNEQEFAEGEEIKRLDGNSKTLMGLPCYISETQTFVVVTDEELYHTDEEALTFLESVSSIVKEGSAGGQPITVFLMD